MNKSMFGRTARVVYADAQPWDFVQVAEDLHHTLSQLDGTDVSFGWEGAATAVFNVSGVRILLRTDDCNGDTLTCLTVAVELSPNGSDPGLGTVCETTCASVIDHLQRRYPGVTTMQHRQTEPVAHRLQARRIAAVPSLPEPPGSPALDDVSLAGASGMLNSAESAEVLRAHRGEGPKTSQHPIRASFARSGRTGARTRAATARARGGAYFTTSAKSSGPFPRIVDEPSLPVSHDVEFARVRSAFNYVEPEVPSLRLSTPLRLTTHALNASLIMVWAPLGAGVMAYSLVRGESTRFSGRMVVLTGLFAAALNTPFGQYMSTMIGV